MTLRAGHIDVLSGEREFGPVMREFRGRFPTVRRVALLAHASELRPVDVGVAAPAITRKSKVRMAIHQPLVFPHVSRGDL
jgi:hypothetical protein